MSDGKLMNDGEVMRCGMCDVACVVCGVWCVVCGVMCGVM